MQVCGSCRGRIASIASHSHRAGQYFRRGTAAPTTPRSRALLSHISATPQNHPGTSLRTHSLQVSACTLPQSHLFARTGQLAQQLSSVSTLRMASTASTEAPDWSAQKVRDTFLQFFQDRGHTFGMFNLVIQLHIPYAAQAMLKMNS